MGVTIKREVSNVTKNLKNLKSGYVDVGWFPSARYNDEKSTPVASVAEENEYGNPAKNIPARPFLRPAISNYQKILLFSYYGEYSPLFCHIALNHQFPI